jgi:hypothetical protein
MFSVDRVPTLTDAINIKKTLAGVPRVLGL